MNDSDFSLWVEYAAKKSCEEQMKLLEKAEEIENASKQKK